MRDRLARLVGALWAGSAFFLIVAASAAFRAAPNPDIAGNVVGAMLTRWHYIALGAPLALFVIELRRERTFVFAILFAALLLASAQALVDLRLRALRESSSVSIGELDPGDPLRRGFAALHGVSMLLLLLETIAAAAVVMSKKENVAVMSSNESEDTTVYKVVMNHEEQYSIWPADRENPLGWNDAGFQGTKAECLAYIEQVWTDMRPLSLRKKLEEQAGGGSDPSGV